MKLLYKVIFGFFACAIILFVTAFMLYRNNNKVMETNKWVSHTHEVIFEFEQILVNTIDAETGERGFLIMGNKSYLHPYDDANSKVFAHLYAINEMTKDDAVMQHTIAEINKRIMLLMDYLQKNIIAKEARNDTEIISVLTQSKGKEMIDEIRTLIDDTKTKERKLLVQEEMQSAKDFKSFNFLFIVLLMSVTLLLFTLYIIILRGMKTLHLSKQKIQIYAHQLMELVQDKTDRTIEIQRLNNELEEKVKARTAELEATTKDIKDYKFALDTSSIVSITDACGTISYVNYNFCTISKYSREELIGQNNRMLNSGFHPTEFFEHLWKTLCNGNIWKGDIKNKAKDGSYYWEDTTIVPFLDGNGKPYKYLAIRSDITQRVNKKEELRISEEKYRNIYENSVVALFTSDLRIEEPHKAFEVNDMAVELLGYKSQKDFIDNYITSNHFVYQHDVENNTRILLETGIIRNSVKQMKKVDGTPFWANIFVKINQEKTLVQTMLIDITQQVNMYDNLRINEEKYRNIYENSLVALFTVDWKKSITIEANEVGVKLYGYKSKEDVLENFLMKNHFIDPEELEDHISILNKKGELRNSVSELKKADGTPFWAKIFIKLNDEKTLAHIAVTDITEQINSIHGLTMSEERYRNLFQSSLVSIHVADMDRLKAVEANATAAKLFGYKSKKDFIDNYEARMHYVHPEEWDEIMKILKEKGEIKQSINERIRVDGSRFWAKMSIKLNFDKTLSQTVIMDITDQMLSQDELEEKVVKRTQELTESLERERKLNEMKSRFVSLVSHEFRTPLGVILSSSSLIEMYKETEQQDKRMKHIKRISTSVQNLTDILTDFMNFEMLEKGIMIAENKVFNLPEFLLTLREEMSTVAGIKHQTISYNHTGDELVEQSEKILRNVLLNLFSNASKYSQEGNEIELISIISHNMVMISVKDNGIGIPMEDQDKLFTEFFRAGNVENIQGTGLGLSIVKKYMDLLEGTITFESNAEEGTIFTIEFPQNYNYMQR